MTGLRLVGFRIDVSFGLKPVSQVLPIGSASLLVNLVRPPGNPGEAALRRQGLTVFGPTRDRRACLSFHCWLPQPNAALVLTARGARPHPRTLAARLASPKPRAFRSRASRALAKNGSESTGVLVNGLWVAPNAVDRQLQEVEGVAGAAAWPSWCRGCSRPVFHAGSAASLRQPSFARA